jgi:energy-coupling factor transporter ATP-binding protein EcfA2
MGERGYGAEQDVPPSAAAREHSKGRINARPPEEFEHAGLTGDDRVRHLLSAIADHYDPELVAEIARENGGEHVRIEDNPPHAKQTRLYQQLIGREATETLTRAVHLSNESTVSYVTGSPQTTSDISGLRATQTLKNVAFDSAPILYLYGKPGSGKTNMALLLSELWQQENPDGELGSNIRSWRECDEWIPRYPALKSWLDEQTTGIEGGGITRREDANPRLFVFDEASSHASGRGKDGHEAGKKLGPLVYKIRKANAGLIIIGHDGRDVHPAVRTLAVVIERYRREFKRATLWEDVENRQGKGLIAELDGVPETSYTYDDGEATYWSWDHSGPDDHGRDVEEEIEERAAEKAEERIKTEARRMAALMATDPDVDMINAEIGQLIGEWYRGESLSGTWVTKWKNRFEDGEI